ncbi:MAG: VWA domain-containing protein [Spirochaetales bacterium]|nr:VWA domain-containing protein [Spirochaetales bacterium]
MNETIHAILNDLYEVDPSLKEKETELKKIIEKLVSSKPDVTMDEEFRKTLKKRLLREFTDKSHPVTEWLGRHGMKIAVTAAAAVFCAVFGFAVFIPLWQTMKSEDTINTYTGPPEGMIPGTEGIVPDAFDEDIPEPKADKQESENPAEAGERGRTASKETESSGSAVKKEEKEYKPDEKKKTAAQEENPPSPGEKGIFAYSMIDETSGMDMELYEASAEEERKTDERIKLLSSGDEADWNTEEYDRIYENRFLKAVDNPLSTFSIDVDTASYANVRRFITDGRLPYPDAVRIEELVNYFTYEYPQPSGEHPFAFYTEISECPWNTPHRLIHIGIQGKEIPKTQLPPNNLVFLIDTSGSMESQNKLPLLKKAFSLLVDQLRQEDRVAIAVYASAAGLVLPPTAGTDKGKIIGALERLSAGGSTAGGAGISLAYETAEKYYNPQGNNRVILATDGDFNVGVSSDAELVRLIEEKRNKGIFLTILGFGMGNYKDSKMEKLADKGNGNYAYIDTVSEAKKVLVEEMGSTLLTIAKDVKIQIEFNPARVDSYRLIGYENRVMAKEDFADDTKDAGELGAGHSVTALYEIVPSIGDGGGTELKYQETRINDGAYNTDEIMTMKFRYKKPKGDTSILIEIPVRDEDIPLTASSDNFRFASAVAEWGLLLRNSEHKADASYEQVLDLAGGSRGKDEYGYREEFISLVTAAMRLAGEHQ